MTYLYVSVVFLVLVAAAFGVSRLWRWVKYELVHHVLFEIESGLHDRFDDLEHTAKADLNSLKDHTAHVVQAARADVQRVEQLVKDITK